MEENKGFIKAKTPECIAALDIMENILNCHDYEPPPLNQYKIRYSYSATGMEGRTDRHPELIILAINEDMAAFFYNIICSPLFYKVSYLHHLNMHPASRFWGLKIEIFRNGQYETITDNSAG